MGDVGVTVQSGQAEQDRQQAESNRDRVRRLLFDPLGFRFERGVDAAEARRRLDAIADELGYLGDDQLAVLARMLRVQGRGSARNWWPDRATFVNLAHLVAPLPLEQDPKLLSWFASVEGPRVLAEGTVVETVDYLSSKRVPPASDQARRMVAERAATNRRRLDVIDDKRAAGFTVSDDDAAWAVWYRGQIAHWEQIVSDLRATKGAA